MINLKTLVTADLIDDPEDLERLTEEQILEGYSCHECGDINWERYNEGANLEELRCATCKTPPPDDNVF